MKSTLQPWQILLLILGGWINKHQQDAIDYLIAENRILREKLGKRRILLTDAQRRKLAIKGKVLGRKVLRDICCIVTPETILRWHRTLIADKWSYSKLRGKVGRPSINREVRAGKPSFRRTGMFWQPLISRPLRFGQRADWPHSICYL